MGNRENFAARLPPLELSTLVQRGRVVEYRVGDRLMCQGEEGNCVIVVRTGFVKIISHHPAGGVRLLGVCEPGELLGEMACLDDRPRSVSVVAGGPVSGVKIARSRFLDYLDEFPRAAREVVRQVSRRLRAAEDHHMVLTADGVDTRVLRVLADMGELFARRDGRRTVTVPLSQSEVSQLAAVSLVSAQRSLRGLRDRALIETRYGRIALSCADCLRRAARPENHAKSITGCGGGPACPSS